MGRKVIIVGEIHCQILINFMIICIKQRIVLSFVLFFMLQIPPSHCHTALFIAVLASNWNAFHVGTLKKKKELFLDSLNCGSRQHVRSIAAKP